MAWGSKGTRQYKDAYKEWLKTPVGKAYKKRSNARQIARHKEWIDRLKLQRGCENCGFNKWPECLDFDHRDPSTKKFSISKKLQLSTTALQKEIAKCSVLCANCHRHKSKHLDKYAYAN